MESRIRAHLDPGHLERGSEVILESPLEVRHVIPRIPPPSVFTRNHSPSPIAIDVSGSGAPADPRPQRTRETRTAPHRERWDRTASTSAHHGHACETLSDVPGPKWAPEA